MPATTINPTVIEANDVVFVSVPSSILREAIQDFEESRQAVGQFECHGTDEVWSVLANQVVGHEHL